MTAWRPSSSLFDLTTDTFVQTNTMLLKQISRDRARNLDRPVLEEVCLHGALIKDENIAILNKYHPFVHCHRKRSTSLESSTWVGQ